MNNEMREERGKQNIQRTLVISWGTLAEEAGRRLEKMLAASNEPKEAVAHVAVKAGAPEEETAASLRQAVLEISQVTRRETLARRGWHLDRLDEVAVLLVVDLSVEGARQAALALAAEAATVVRSSLSVEVALLLVTLAPTQASEEVDSELAALAGERQLFTRGILTLGTVNEVGLCLEGPEALASAASRMLYALIATPMRDALEWLSEQAGPAMQSMVHSAGIVRWQWSPAVERMLLARYWVQTVLRQWLGEAKEDATAALVEGWIGQQGLEPEKALRRFHGMVVGVGSTPVTSYPQPWKLRETFLPLCYLPGVELQQHQEALKEEAARMAGRAGVALQAFAAEMLDNQPVAGPARLISFIGGIKRRLGEWQDQLTGSHLVQAERIRALEEAHARLSGEMQEQLARWPADTIRAWAVVALRPWRWLQLAKNYWQMQQQARALQQLIAEWRQWRLQQAGNEAADDLATLLAGEAGKRMQQADELVDMLRNVQRTAGFENVFWPSALANRFDYLKARYEQLADRPAVEAVWAAGAIGGLGQQLLEPDDAFLDPLLTMVERRFEAHGAQTAAGALALLHPEKGGLPAWWQQQWEAAVPLWRFDRTGQHEWQRAHPTQLTVTCGEAARQLCQMLGLEETAEQRWVTAPIPDLFIMRIRGAIPTGPSGSDSGLIEESNESEDEKVEPWNE